jgi:hypothetical protein
MLQTASRCINKRGVCSLEALVLSDSSELYGCKCADTSAIRTTLPQNALHCSLLQRPFDKPSTVKVAISSTFGIKRLSDIVMFQILEHDTYCVL